MALDGVQLNLGSGGDQVGADKIAGIQYEVVKQAFGTEGSITLVDASHPLPTTDAAAETSLSSIDGKLSVPTTIFNGKKVTVTAGTRVALSTTQAIKSVAVTALSTNTGIIYVGNATVAASNGSQLVAGQSVTIPIADLATVNIDSSVSGEGVTYLAVN